ncbi:MAG: 30S ribosomal protein S12 methylthiotransferase RimO [Gemmatimonadetes bacterium]|nr:30S ribosomal protein S12 methylthiotransferase RimO [Gemmatimonadota bacterium]
MSPSPANPRISLPVLPVLPAPAAAGAGAADAAAATGVRIGLLTLGCDKNTVDSERLLARLAAAGAELAADPADADVVVVNTCGFIDAAKEESIETILEALRLKRQGAVRAVVAVGCLVQRYKPELEQELPEVDLFLGLTEADRLVPSLRARGVLPAAPPVATMERPLRLLSTRTRHTSYLKVSEGCDHTCAFCAIPLMRGRHRSTPPELLLAEARELERQGVVELNLISQDTTWYGRDLQRGAAPGEGDWFVGRTFDGMAGPHDPEVRVGVARAGAAAERRGMLPDLLRRLLAETGIPWFRLFYMYPSGIQRELVELMAREPRLLPYLDLPIQHGADSVLRRMRRPERRATIRERVGWLRAAVPDVTLRTTVIVGFPGETDDEFAALLDLLEEVRFDRVGAFPYSVEEGTPAAQLPDQVADGVKRERLERLLEVQRGITLERNELWVGREVTVLIDGVTGRDAADGTEYGRGASARTPGQALEVDGIVHIADARGAEPGQFVRARITDALEDDLMGAISGS